MDLSGLVLADRYQLLRLIGRGGMGEVWHSRDTSILQREVAIKLMPAVSSTISVRRFDREAATLARLQHPGITVVHDVGRHAGYLYIVMELLRGQDLARTIAGSPGGFAVERVLDLLHQTVDALAKAHHDGVVHRDLKPANLFVQPGDRIKICDFGIARNADASEVLTASGVALGTLPYMSPEQCQGRPAEAASDLYALGVVLFELLTGRTPFRPDQSPYALMRQHVEEPPPRLGVIRPDVPRELADLVARLLAKDPEQRPDATTLARALSGLMDGFTKAEREPGHPRREPATQRLLPPVNDDEGHDSYGDGDDRTVRANRTRVLPVRRSHARLLLSGISVVCAVGLVLGITVLREEGEKPERPDRILHANGAFEVDFSPDGKMLATSGSSSQLIRWDPSTGERIGKPLNHIANVYRLAFSPDSTVLAVASQEGDPVTLYDPRTRDMVSRLPHDVSAESLAFGPDGKTLATGGEDGTVRLWDPKTGEEIGNPIDVHEGPVKDVAFSPDGTTLATVSDGNDVSIGGDDTVQLWNPEAGDEISDALIDHGEHVSALAFSPDGDTLALATAEPNTVQLWDPKTGVQINKPIRHDGEVTDVVFSPNGSELATTFGDGTVGLWRLPRESTG